MIKVWKETVSIPTYEVGKPEKEPIFCEKRVYQGSSGVVYPYPMIERISDKRTDKEYHAIFLENDYIKVMMLPELGGRIQMAYDKIRKRHFIYYNHVIKPALVGLTGPWVSGGIEFNWPQHHRPSTFLPVDVDIVKNSDDSITVWLNEQERMFHQKGMAGVTLYPDKAYLEIKGVVYNRTAVPQTFLWWANPAVAVNDAYQSVFPPDINAVFDHGKRAVSSFPIATGTYYKMDYSSGVDISNYKNLKVPTSYMAVNSRYNYVGGYENDTQAGMLHVANHRLSPGKKQWTWGNGDFGRAWDRNLTETDGPYIELMAGVYTENQPDFSWLMPYEEKHFSQYFMPYRELGIVKQASKDMIFNLITKDRGHADLCLFATGKGTYSILLKDDGGKVIYQGQKDISPEQLLREDINLQETSSDHLSLVVRDVNTGKKVLSWHSEPDMIRPLPDPAQAALPPKEVKTTEQLFLTGLHLEQYRHATYNPVDYYEEALRRDPDDYRCNNALGLLYLRRGRFALAEQYLRRAQRVLFQRNPNPYDGEPLYNLALALKYQGKMAEAYDWFWKSTWNKAWADAGYFNAAQISVMDGRLDDAFDEVNCAFINNLHNHKAYALKVIILRLSGKKKEALMECDRALLLDRFNYGVRYEQYLLTNDKEKLVEMESMMHGMPNNYEELLLDYAQAGRWQETIDIADLAVSLNAFTPMMLYFKGWAQLHLSFHIVEQLNDKKETSTVVEMAKVTFQQAEAADSTYCFPNRVEAVLALQSAIKVNPKGSKAPYYLGCLYYDKRQYALAIQLWTLSAQLQPSFALVWRNLALGYYNKLHEAQKAIDCMEKAFRLDSTDARLFLELDQLYKKMQKSHKDRLLIFMKYPELVKQRDDLLLEEITLLNQTGDYQKAKELIDGHIFHPWEGGEGKVSCQYQISRVELAKQCIVKGDCQQAISLLKECLVYPLHLGEGKLFGTPENDFFYLLGVTYERLGDDKSARLWWEKAAEGHQKPSAALYYNDAKPDKIFYQGMALLKLGRKGQANSKFYGLINYGKKHLFDKVTIDYFAVSLPDFLIWDESLQDKNEVHCKYLLALGYYGLGDNRHCCRYLEEARQKDINHQGITAFMSFIKME